MRFLDQIDDLYYDYAQKHGKVPTRLLIGLSQFTKLFRELVGVEDVTHIKAC